MGGRTASPQPPESEIGEIGGGPKASAGPAQATARRSLRKLIRVIGLLAPVQKLADTQGDAPFTTLLTSWKANLETLKTNLATVDGLTGLKARLTAGWSETPEAFSKSLKTLTENIQAKPDQTRPDQTRPDQTRPDQTRQTRPDRYPRCADIPDDRAASPRRLQGGHEKKQGGRDRVDMPPRPPTTLIAACWIMS